jgi:hypothetical protein
MKSINVGEETRNGIGITQNKNNALPTRERAQRRLKQLENIKKTGRDYMEKPPRDGVEAVRRIVNHGVRTGIETALRLPLADGQPRVTLIELLKKEKLLPSTKDGKKAMYENLRNHFDGENGIILAENILLKVVRRAYTLGLFKSYRRRGEDRPAGRKRHDEYRKYMRDSGVEAARLIVSHGVFFGIYTRAGDPIIATAEGQVTLRELLKREGFDDLKAVYKNLDDHFKGGNGIILAEIILLEVARSAHALELFYPLAVAVPVDKSEEDPQRVRRTTPSSSRQRTTRQRSTLVRTLDRRPFGTRRSSRRSRHPDRPAVEAEAEAEAVEAEAEAVVVAATVPVEARNMTNEDREGEREIVYADGIPVDRTQEENSEGGAPRKHTKRTRGRKHYRARDAIRSSTRRRKHYRVRGAKRSRTRGRKHYRARDAKRSSTRRR